VIIGIGGPDDLAAIVGLEVDGFDHARWSPDAWAEELDSRRGHVLVGRDADGEVVGVATFSHVAEVVDLNRVVGRSDRRGRGLARQLLFAGLEWATAMGAREVLLEVEADNEPALAVYRRMGFVALGRRADYYGTGRHALVMARPLREEERDE